MLLFSFVPFIVHASVFCLHFFRNKVQPSQKKYRGNVLLLHWKAHAKIQVLLKENKFYPKKSLTSLLHQAIQLLSSHCKYSVKFTFHINFHITKLKIHHIYSFVTLPMTLTVLILAVKWPKLLSVSFCSSVDIAPTYVFGRSWVQFLLGTRIFFSIPRSCNIDGFIFHKVILSFEVVKSREKYRVSMS